MNSHTLPKPRPLVLHATLLVVQVLFASNAVAMKFAMRALPPLGLAAIRGILGAFGFVLLHRLLGRGERMRGRDLLEAAVYALVGVVSNQILFIVGVSRTTATNAVVLSAAIPVFTVGIAVLARRERATAGKLAGLALSLGGALVLTVTSWVSSGPGALAGNALIVVNSLCYAIYLVISSRLLVRYRPLTVVAWTFVFGALGILPFGGAPLVRALPGIDIHAWMAIGYIVLGPTIGAYTLNAVALRSAPASLVAIYVLVQPLVGAVLAIALLHERPGVATWLGAPFIVGGIALVTRDARANGSTNRPTPPPPAPQGSPTAGAPSAP